MNSPADSNKSQFETLQRLLTPNLHSTRVVILAAHPDDETIGASLLLAKFPLTRVIFLTDGAPKDRRFWPPDMHGSRENYAAMRRRESAAAMAHAGISEAQISWLGATDQEAIFDAPRLASRLCELLRCQPADVLITHPYEGGHPDHDCAALIARLVIDKKKQTNDALNSAPCRHAAAPVLCEMTSYHARNGACVTGEFLDPDASTEIVLELSKQDRERKQRMTAEYKSQRLVLENFPIVSERLRIAPEYDFSRPPHASKLWYECMNWPITGEKWREVAARCGFAKAEGRSCV